MKILSHSILLALFILAAIAGCNRAKEQNQTPGTSTMAGLVFDVGGRGDKSFNDGAFRGLERAKKELGVDFDYIEPGQGNDREAALRQLASRPNVKLIVGTGFIFTDDITNIAKEFPDKYFACVDYTLDTSKRIPDNLLAIEFKEQEGSFLVGALAALVSKSNVIGFVGGMQSPLIRKFEVAYVAGAKYVRPDITVLVSYAGITGEAFKNPGKGKELALGQIARGADIIYHASGVTGLGVFEAVRDKHKLAIGVDSDQFHEAPGYILTSMTKVVDNSVFETIRDMKNGTFHGGRAAVFGLASKGVDYVYDENNKNLIPDDVHTKVEEIRAKIIAGEISVPFE